MQPNILKTETPIDKFYVYTLARPDGSVFYVGKGKKDRVDQHEKEAAKRCGCPKCQVIRSVWAAGGMVVKTIVFETEAEHKALDRERAMITAARASLCNRTDGCAGKARPIQIDRPRRHSFELYDELYKECLQEIKELDQRMRRAIGIERFNLRAEVKQKKELLTEWHQRAKQMKADIRAHCRELGKTDRIRRVPKKPW